MSKVFAISPVHTNRSQFKKDNVTCRLGGTEPTEEANHPS